MRQRNVQLPGCCATILIVNLICVSDAGAATAAYKATLLHPYGGTFLFGASNFFQVGSGPGPVPIGRTHAMLWADGTEGFIDLHPAPFVTSAARGASDTSQVGQGNFEPFSGQGSHALLWHGLANSVIDLHPPQFIGSWATGVSGNAQVGVGDLPGPGTLHALLWRGTAESVVDLHPAGFSRSQATAVSGEIQVGWGTGFGADRALLWRGTAASVVDLHPPGWSVSEALGASQNSQVGYANFEDIGDGGEYQAILWRGTAASYINLNPPGLLWTSQAFAASDTTQVGWGRGPATGGLIDHAHLWHGTSASAHDLHPYVAAIDPQFNRSYATAINSRSEVFGYAYLANLGPYAIKWSPVPEPPPAALLTMVAIIWSAWKRQP